MSELVRHSGIPWGIGELTKTFQKEDLERDLLLTETIGHGKMKRDIRIDISNLTLCKCHLIPLVRIIMRKMTMMRNN